MSNQKKLKIIDFWPQSLLLKYVCSFGFFFLSLKDGNLKCETGASTK